jgi:hypothetical protein
MMGKISSFIIAVELTSIRLTMFYEIYCLTYSTGSVERRLTAGIRFFLVYSSLMIKAKNFTIEQALALS